MYNKKVKKMETLIPTLNPPFCSPKKYDNHYTKDENTKNLQKTAIYFLIAKSKSLLFVALHVL